MAKIWDIRFAESGDKITIPEPADPGGEVSVTQGWTADYELPDTDPDYKPVGREEMNGAFFEVTDSIQQLQKQGAAQWDLSLVPYVKGAEVIHSGERWYNPVAGNSTEPGAVGTTWVPAGTVAAASETVAGIAESATQVEVDSGAAGNMTVTPAKLRFGFAASLGSSGYVAFPSWMGGLILQWGNVLQSWTTNNDGSPVDFTFPITFPNEVYQVVASQQVSADFVGYMVAAIIGNPTNSKVTVKADGGTSNTAQTNAPLRIFCVGR